MQQQSGVFAARAQITSYRLLKWWGVLLCALVISGVIPKIAWADVSGEPELAEAQYAIVMDAAGNVLYSKDADSEQPMASITKIMTAMVALDSGRSLDDVFTISDADLGGEAQAAGYEEGDTPTFRELLNAMLVFSANDAAYNIAVNIAGSEDAFVERMNQKAAELGMTHTHFMNSHGLEVDGHYSSARDLATMGRYAYEHYPLISQIVSQHTTTVHVHGTDLVLGSTDELMGVYPGMRGIKTGKISNATTFLGACERQGVQLFTCVLGCSTSQGRFSDTMSLLNWAYDTYTVRSAARKRQILSLKPYAYNFFFKVMETPTLDVDMSLWPDDSGASYTTQRLSAASLVDVNTPTGSTTWMQSNRTVAHVIYSTNSLVRCSSWPIFTLPLMGVDAQ
ncbi:MAG: D-alanyl-D-alanine carboxypeptidase family protein [Atopobiaceae bacterium]|jgi:D-alanyl-D-alanine carboxypeptidase (penicillin-binding protein 5/6)